MKWAGSGLVALLIWFFPLMNRKDPGNGASCGDGETGRRARFRIWYRKM